MTVGEDLPIVVRIRSFREQGLGKVTVSGSDSAVYSSILATTLIPRFDLPNCSRALRSQKLN